MSQSWAEFVAKSIESARLNRLPVPQGPIKLDGDIWLVRTVAEQDEEVCCAYAAQRSSLRAGVEPLEAAPQGLALYGLNDAARWTCGDTAEAPVGRRPRPVAGVVIIDEMALAINVMEDRAKGWQQAAGAFAWLRWVIGADNEITYPT